MSRFKFILILFVFFAACKNDAPAPKPVAIDSTAPSNQIIPAAKPAPPTVVELDTVSISSIEELVENAKSNSVLILEKGTYTLKEDMVYSMTKEERKIIDKNVVETRSVGGQLFIKGLTNFQILGNKGVKIISNNPIAVPFFIIQGKNLKFSNLTITKEVEGKADLCYISNSREIEIDQFNLDGGGKYGMYLNNVNNMKVNNTKISKFTSGVLRINESKGIQFINSTFTDNVCTVPLVNLYGNGSVVSFNNVTLSDNIRNPNFSYENSDRLFAVNGNVIRLDNCTIRNNKGYTNLGVNQNSISRSQIEGVNY